MVKPWWMHLFPVSSVMFLNTWLRKMTLALLAWVKMNTGILYTLADHWILVLLYPRWHRVGRPLTKLLAWMVSKISPPMGLNYFTNKVQLKDPAQIVWIYWAVPGRYMGIRQWSVKECFHLRMTNKAGIQMYKAHMNKKEAGSSLLLPISNPVAWFTSSSTMQCKSQLKNLLFVNYFTKK